MALASIAAEKFVAGTMRLTGILPAGMLQLALLRALVMRGYTEGTGYIILRKHAAKPTDGDTVLRVYAHRRQLTLSTTAIFRPHSFITVTNIICISADP